MRWVGGPLGAINRPPRQRIIKYSHTGARLEPQDHPHGSRNRKKTLGETLTDTRWIFDTLPWIGFDK